MTYKSIKFFKKYFLVFLIIPNLLILLLLFNPSIHASGWRRNYAPTVGSLTPANGSSFANETIAFNTNYRDRNGYYDLKKCSFLINTSMSGSNCFYAYYYENTNRLYLRNDGNNQWLGGFAPGSDNIIENSYVRLDCSQTSVSTSRNNLYINWSISFKNEMAGNTYNTYLKAEDDAYVQTSWVQRGTWTVEEVLVDNTPPVITIAPVSSPTNQDVVLSYTVTDNITPPNQIQVSGDDSPYSSDGVYNVVLTAHDLAGNSATDTISFEIDKTPPEVFITSPEDGATVEASEITIEGYVDDTPFSESRTLTEGANTITKSVTDPAGNTGSDSIIVNLNSGTYIDASGGEVISSDGKVKLIIPGGALSVGVYITILSPKVDELEGTEPVGQDLVCAAEFIPYYLTFNKPVELIYTLNQAEVPGTGLQLGLYDSVNDEIVPTGQYSAVDTDGYTVKFMLDHFSTYGALKGSISSGTPIGSGIDIPLPDMFTGAFGHSIPLTVVPGRKKMQPNLAISYRSSNPNSWLGVGFGLNPGYIVRSTRLGPPTYNDEEDSFYFINDAGSTELIHLTDNLYQAKIESSFTKFFKEADDTWRVVQKDGMTLYFGKTANSKETSVNGTFSWYISQVIDTNGNYVDYAYTKDQGKTYIEYIDYTGNINTSLTPSNRVEFYLESRNDVLSNYISGDMIKTAQRLSSIEVKQLGELVWRYELSYDYSSDTDRSLLKTITQYSADGIAFPSQTFSFQGN